MDKGYLKQCHNLFGINGHIRAKNPMPAYQAQAKVQSGGVMPFLQAVTKILMIQIKTQPGLTIIARPFILLG